MKTMLMAIVVFAVASVPSFAADLQAPGTGSMKQPMGQDRDAKMEMMRAPQFQLMMAYHRNLITFARALDNMAHNGETVPPEYARAAVWEMRHSVEQLEKYRTDIVPAMTAGKDFADMKKKMDQHLVKVKTQVRDLEDLVKQNPVRSPEVIKRLHEILEGCEEMDCGMGHGQGKHCGGMREKESNCGRMHEHGCGCHEMTPEHREMMEDAMRKVKVQDAELAALVDSMNRAPQDNKLNLLADIVTRIVQQRAAMTAHMEKMMQRHMRHQDGVRMSPSGMNNPEDEDADNDEDTDMGDMYDDTPGLKE